MGEQAYETAESFHLASTGQPQKKPIDDVFRAIDRVDASIETKATRYILSELDQKMTKAQWKAYVQKATSPAGVWGPDGEGGKTVKLSEVPAAIKKIHNQWLKSETSDVHMVELDVAGKSAYLLSQYSEDGTAFGLFDASGKTIEFKEDTQNVNRNRRRIQDAFGEHFNTADMKAWKGTVTNTDLGVLRNYRAKATAVDTKDFAERLNDGMRKVLTEDKGKLKGDAVDQEAFRNKSNGSILLVTSDRTGRGAEHFALFNKSGELVKRFSIDV